MEQFTFIIVNTSTYKQFIGFKLLFLINLQTN